MEITGEIQSIKYKQKLSDTKYEEYDISGLKKALEKESKFLLNVDTINKIVVSRWVSAKRTRSYPYARVYDILPYAGKKIAVIPIYKDEGRDGDRDYLQWDTISLMSLLGVNVIISYYNKADKKKNYENKITNQRFDVEHVLSEIKKLVSYKSCALHWNLEQVANITDLLQTAVESYKKISSVTKVNMHLEQEISEKIKLLKENKENFINMSRKASEKAQSREILTIQPKEKINSDEKSKITISNYLGGYYYFTVDEARISDENNNNNRNFRKAIDLVEAKHSSKGKFPSLADIKDGLIKMMLYSNLKKVYVNGEKNGESEEYEVNPVLKLTSDNPGKLNSKQSQNLKLLKEEAELNGFYIEYTEYTGRECE